MLSVFRGNRWHQRRRWHAGTAAFALTAAGVAISSRAQINHTEESKSFNVQQKRKRYDLVVVGAGVAGASVALFAKRFNPAASILLLDSDTVGAGSSSHSAGTVWLPQSLSNLRGATGRAQEVDAMENGSQAIKISNEISPHWDEVLASATVDIYSDLEEAGYDCELVRSGALLIATTSEQRKYVAGIFLDLAMRGYDCVRGREDKSQTRLELLEDRESLLRVENRLKVNDGSLHSHGVLSALHLPASVHVETNKATWALAQCAMDIGVELRENARVVSLVRKTVNDDADRVSWSVCLEDGVQLNADKVVIACGATVSRLLPEANVVVPVKGQIVQSASAMPEGWLSKILFSASAHADFASGKAKTFNKANNIPPECTHDNEGKRLTRHLYGRQKRDGIVIMGGGRIPRPQHLITGLDYEVDGDILRDVVEHSREIVNDPEGKLKLGEEEIQSNSWACFMPFSMDGRPYYGRLDGRPGLFLAIGLGPEGMTWGPGAGKILAAEIWDLRVSDYVPFAETAQRAMNPNGGRIE